MLKSIIIGTGHHLPDRIVTNQELESMIDTTDEWIQERTGIKERRYFEPDKDTVANMAARAARMALDEAKLEASEIEFIVFATITPDYFFPGSGVLLQRELGLQGIGALDIRNACSGFIYALSIADQFIKTGMYRRILVVGAEIQSSAMEMNSEGRDYNIIFADGAGAVILEASESEGRGILSTHLHADGDYAEELYLKDPGSSRKVRLSQEVLDGPGVRLHMNGNGVFKHAVVRFPEVIHEALDANGLSIDDIDLLIPHQANLRISQAVQRRLGLPDEKVYNNITMIGNTTAASIPIALSQAAKDGKLSQGDLVCFAAFGSGFTWASALIRW